MTFTCAEKKATHIQIWKLCGNFVNKMSKLEKVGQFFQVQFFCILVILSYR